MTTDKTTTTARLVGGKLITGIVREIADSPSAMNWREALSAKQARIIEIAKRRNMPLDAPISDLQYGAPTVKDLQGAIYPDFTASIDSFLSTFDK